MTLTEIFFTPRAPGPQHFISHVLAGLKLAAKSAQSPSPLGFLGDGTTYAHLSSRQLREIAGRRLINLACTDISKRHVDKVFARIFGYSVEVDPLVYTGKAVRKSNKNFSHDGEVIELPLSSVDPQSVYNLVVDNRVDDDTVEDLRVYIVGGTVACIVEKRRPLIRRFAAFTPYARFVPDCQDVLSSVELANISSFCIELGLEFGELDVLRDRGTRRLYIVDANRCTSGPPLALEIEQAVDCVERVCEVFRDTVLLSPSTMIDRDAIRFSLFRMRRLFPSTSEDI